MHTFKIYPVICYTILIFILNGCSRDVNNNPNCQFLLDLDVMFDVNLNLPQFSQLNFTGSSVYIPNIGNSGIIVVNTGSSFLAWDAADPNEVLQPCSTLSASGLFAVSGCENQNRYELLTGQPTQNENLPCPLKNYRVQQSGTILTIIN